MGAILAFALDAALFPYFDLKVVGYIFMASGAIGLMEATAVNRPRWPRRVTGRSVVDPATGENIAGKETHGSDL